MSKAGWTIDTASDSNLFTADASHLCKKKTLPQQISRLGPPVVPFYPFWGEGSPTQIDYRKQRITLF